MTFSKIFSKTWNDYKNNFREIFKFVLIFAGIPYFILTIINLIWIFSNDTVRQLVLNPSLLSQEGFSIPFYYSLINGLFGVILFLILFFIMASLTAISVKKQKFNLNELINIGKQSYFRYIGFCSILLIFLIGPFLLLIIPAIIFLIYWTFAIYVLYDKKESILGSLSESKKIVNGGWWMVFGYSALIFLIIYSPILILSLPTFFAQKIYFLNKLPIPIVFGILNILIQYFISLITYILIYPFSILFFKNFYFDLKKKKK